ncbi:hypothetical protein GOODEAATRI_018258 [Goodea atripinnis]|uniref:Myelin basic protein n=1 Tax=Goodea atripinnis TaxID=208336 RepID=A0ABV0PZM2_9TELE
MPAMSVASVAPAKHKKRKVGFFRRSSTDLKQDGKGLSCGFHPSAGGPQRLAWAHAPVSLYETRTRHFRF